jgi:hypothetical protein
LQLAAANAARLSPMWRASVSSRHASQSRMPVSSSVSFDSRRVSCRAVQWSEAIPRAVTHCRFLRRCESLSARVHPHFSFPISRGALCQMPARLSSSLGFISVRSLATRARSSRRIPCSLSRRLQATWCPPDHG